MSDPKDFFRQARRMFDELDAEHEQEKATKHRQHMNTNHHILLTAAALAGLISNPTITLTQNEEVAAVAVAFADATLKELEKEEAPNE